VVQLHIRLEQLDAVVLLRAAAPAISQEGLVWAPAFVDVDASGIYEVRAQGEVQAAGGGTGVGEDRDACLEVGVALGGSTWRVPETMIVIGCGR
jgi:hypothetical protein